MSLFAPFSEASSAARRLARRYGSTRRRRVWAWRPACAPVGDRGRPRKDECPFLPLFLKPRARHAVWRGDVAARDRVASGLGGQLALPWATEEGREKMNVPFCPFF